MAAPVITSVAPETPSSSGTAKPTTKKSPPRAAPTSPPPLLYQPYPLANEWGFQNAVPISQPVSRGYDIAATRIGTKRRAAALNSANAILTAPIGGTQYQMSLFITDTNMDSALAGSTAQARLTRDFYPHNFIQPTIQCLGLSLDQEDYGLLCEFIHAAQHYAINNGQTGLTQLFVAGRNNPSQFGTAFSRGFNGNRPSHKGNRNISVSGSSSGAQNGTWWNQNLKGTHSPILAQGYVNSMPREHEQFEYVVQWELDFTVSVMLDGIYTDSSFNSASLLQDSNTALMNGVQNDAMPITAALQKQNKAALAYAAKNATAFFGASQTSFGGGGGTGGGSSSGGSSSGGGGGPAPSGGVSVPGIKSSDAEAAISTAIAKWNIPSGIFYGMFYNETTLGAGIATSSAGAVGPFQFEPSTAGTYNYPLTNSPTLLQFQEQANAAAHFLSDLYNQLGKSWKNALGGYNGGAGNYNGSAEQSYADQAISWAQSQNLPVS